MAESPAGRDPSSSREICFLGEDPLNSSVLPVYMLERVARSVDRHCREAVPDEALGKLYGYREVCDGIRYVRVVDWATGEVDAGPTHARFTDRGVRQCALFLDERYGDSSSRPVEVGIYHSHPFGVEPHFSSVDRATFGSFPYDTEGNVYVLVDPVGEWFKVYVFNRGGLEAVEWGLVRPEEIEG